MSREEDKDHLLTAALTHVAFEGWTDRALRLGARDAELPPSAVLRLFPGGVAEAISYWSETSDQRMLEELDRLDLARMRVRDRLAAAIRARIQVNAHHREAVRRTLSWLNLPWHAALAAKLTFRTINAMWYAAGDRATDFNWYTKRATLAAVYAATVLYWLDDESEGAAATWAFLDRRLDDVLSLTRGPRRRRSLFSPAGPHRA